MKYLGPLVGKWIKILWYIHTLEHNSALKNKTADICNDMDKSQNNYADQKKQNTKEYILQDFIHMKLQKR